MPTATDEQPRREATDDVNLEETSPVPTLTVLDASPAHGTTEVTGDSEHPTVSVADHADEAPAEGSDDAIAASPYPLVMRRVHAIISAVHAIAEHGLDTNGAVAAATRAVKRLHALTDDLPPTIDLAGVLDDLDDVGIGEVLVAAHEALAVVAAAAEADEADHDHMRQEGAPPAEVIRALANGGVVVRAGGAPTQTQPGPTSDTNDAPSGVGGYL